MKKLQFRQFKISGKVTENFTLTPLELREYIDFEVVRIYFITDVSGPTGSHCHMEEKELFVMIQGSVTAVIDRGNGLEEIPLEGKRDALYVGSYIWHHFKDFSNDAVMLALTSTHYNPDRLDYIEDYSQYLDLRGQLKK